MRIKFGNYETKYTREDGVVVEEKETYQNGHLSGKDIKYTIRKKVSDEKQELAEWLKFRQDHKDAPALGLRTEKKSWLGKDYYIVLTWEERVSGTKD